MQCGFGILRVESAKAVQNLGIFRGKCEMLTEPGIFCVENTKCRAAFRFSVQKGRKSDQALQS